ncbi:MAG TPA: magnesium transporter [Actinomycetota bacterium]|nr:magnesium transporter [Actinomycetota bacterium]
MRWLARLVGMLLGAPARAVRGTARRVGDPARQVFDYWASERTTMRQAFVANFISVLTSLVAGLTLAGMSGRLDQIEGLFILIPVSIGMRGNIFGGLSARLGTSIHSGLFEVTTNRRGILAQNVYAATLLTVGTSVAMGVLARSVAALLGLTTISVWAFIVVALIGGLLSSVFVLVFTVVLSIQAFRRGWDLDSVGAVLITTVGDVVTLPCLLLASYLLGIHLVTPIVGVVGLLVGIVAVVHGWTVVLPVARRIVRESFPVLCIAIVLDILAGTAVQPRLEHFLAYGAFLLVIPGFLENTGALGSILAARLGSKLHLGAVPARARPDAVAFLDGSVVLLLGVVVYGLTVITTLPVAEIFNEGYPGVLRFVGIVMLGGMLATVVACVIGYYAAILTFRFGLDPDNHTIPLVTSGMDLLGVICFVVALVVFGVA